MKRLTGRELARLLESHGWTLLRIRGSHHIYGKTGHRARISIPIHGNRPLRAGLQNHLVSVAGLSTADLER